MKKRIAVIGKDDPAGDEALKAAEVIGRKIGEAGCVLVCGGRGGVMEAACRGAKSVGGLTVGILPSHGGEDANDCVDVVIPTGIGYARNSIVVASADAVIAVNGSTGTLSEIAMALNYDKKVVCVKGTGGVTENIKNSFPDDEKIQKIVEAEAEHAVQKALSA